MEEVVGLARQTARAAHHTDSAKLAKTLWDAALSGYRRMRQIKLYVTRNEEVEQTVVVVVAPGGSCGPTAKRDAGFFGGIGKRSIVFVVVQPILAVIRDTSALPALVFLLAHRYPASPASL